MVVTTGHRAVQRSLGTLSGLVITAGIMALHPSQGVTIVIAAVAVGLAQPLLAKELCAGDARPAGAEP
ncbi:FUSC family protein [Streptomyces sp. NPDC087901]|uniref:FUSC family protein n=1 Tax=Streptomyces sp. NPDC087901 TaxID=3365818 RepID=UPI00381F2CE2